ncbi:MAG: 1,4-alpha-glucan branching enzyme [Fibrobacteria bacterium]|jgi:trehalose synthase-fused probable maltokinase|nr:1,4-alpha-glucan branching enzyme [Fibrobacteria bacterium]
MPDLSELLETEGSVLERLLADWIPQRRWYRSKARTLASVALEAHAPLGPESDAPRFCLVRTTFGDGSSELYAVPLALREPVNALDPPEAGRIGRIAGAENLLCDASWDPRFRRALFELLEGRKEIRWGGGILRGTPVPGRRLGGAPSSRLLGAEQSNTSFAYASGDFVKLYRRVEQEVNPEPEILGFLRAAGWTHTPPLACTLEWVADGRPPATLAVMQDLVESRGDAWEHALANLREGPSGAYLEWTRLLGTRVAGLHAALRAPLDVPGGGFSPEPLTDGDVEDVRAGVRAQLGAVLETLESRLPALDPGTAASAREVLRRRPFFEDRLRAPAHENLPEGAVKTRTHGDLHLGQILVGMQDPPDAWILDFEGEPGRPLAEARRKQSPLRDVAGMLRSFHYAAHAARRSGSTGDADALAQTLGKAFREGYARAAGFDLNAEAHARLLDLFILEKAVYELHYELNNRPDWVEIPLRGLLNLLEDAHIKP